MTLNAAPLILPAVPLTEAGFAPFGSVAAAGTGRATSVNDGRGVRYDAGHGLGCTGGGMGGGTGGPLPPVLSIYRIAPSRLPFAVEAMERHPFSSQTFVPMTGGRYLVVAAPADASGAPDPAGARAYAAGPGQAITYAAGVWHCPLAALGEAADFAMMMWQAPDPGDDCRIARLSVPLLVTDPAA
ncbi:ureidoglycolate lyase [Azospirillum sp. C340-1]|uniref:Ureidoglycolate lyase n=2 Tax=Azospirillum isscasi TaxID=3053926 RepID=A0ABU0WA99_9PROT|nr:ureidoglycolate lyase [Azospirillum isscasi]